MRWEISHIQLAWKWAKNNYPELAYLDNPWQGIEVEGSTSGTRNRGLDLDDDNDENQNELERLIQACEGCLGLNRCYLPLAINLAVDTGMRRREIIELHWEDIDFKKRRIRLKKTKIDRKVGRSGTEIVLPRQSAAFLLLHYLCLRNTGAVAGVDPIQVMKSGEIPSGPIFYDYFDKKPWTGMALTQAFDATTARAKIADLHFHDLRTVANTRFELANLSAIEKNVQKGGKPGRYHGLNELLRSVEEKLDRYDNRRMGGRSFREMKKERQTWLKVSKEALAAGLTDEEAFDKANAAAPFAIKELEGSWRAIEKIKSAR